MNDIGIKRRGFIGGTMAATAVGSMLGALPGRTENEPASTNAPAPAAKIGRKIKVGVVGGGHRGNFIGGFMKRHGGYEMHACADYFPNVAQALGNNLGVDKSRRFSGLSGYKKVIESGVGAIAILDVPYFYPEQAKDAVDAGLNVYIAKPVAVDVPGTLTIGASAEAATKKSRCFLVDYQLRSSFGAVQSTMSATSAGPSTTTAPSATWPTSTAISPRVISRTPPRNAQLTDISQRSSAARLPPATQNSPWPT